MDRKTPLYDKHIELGAKMVSFAGYSMPVQYKTGIIKEHMAVRTTAGIFDVSHMGEFVISGKDAEKNLDYLLTNSIKCMSNGQIRYSPMCNENGGIIDDLIAYKLNDEKFMLVVNASNMDKDKWILDHLNGDVTFKDKSDEISLIALQGPLSKDIITVISEVKEIPIKYYSFTDKFSLNGAHALISRTGYTGEYGYEIYIKNEDAPKIWDMLLSVGNDYNILPCGLGARDTLRFEASMPLYGNEMSEDITPFEAGLDFAVKMDKNFIGKEALENKKATRKRMGIEVVGRGIIREDAHLFIGERQIGITTSGTYAPYLKKALAMALVDIDYAKHGVQIEAEVRGRRIPARIIDLPFIKK